MIRAIPIFVLLCSTLFVRAETINLTSAETVCTRPSLEAAANKYLDALNKGNPSLMPLASQAKYIENRNEFAFGKGIWQTALDINFHRSLFDVDTCQAFTEIIHTSGSHPYVIGTRLKITGNKISEVTIPWEIAWRIFTKGIALEEARAQVQVTREEAVGLHILKMISIVG